MDLETVFLVSGLVAAWAGSIAAIMHMIGYIPPRYRTQLAAIQSTTAAAIGQELRAVFSEQEIKMAAAMEQAEKAQQLSPGQIQSQLLNASKALKFDQRQVDSALSEAILGPALPILRAFAPGLADTLEEHPEYAGAIIEHPLFKKYVAPRIEQLMGKAQEGHLSTDGSSWG